MPRREVDKGGPVSSARSTIADADGKCEQHSSAIHPVRVVVAATRRSNERQGKEADRRAEHALVSRKVGRGWIEG